MRDRVKPNCSLIVAGICAALSVSFAEAVFATECKPRHFRAPYFIKSMGVCDFDLETLSYAGTPLQQARCLLRGMDASRNLGPPLDSLPPGLARRIGKITDLLSREVLAAYLSRRDLEAEFGAHLWESLSRARNNNPDAPMARYFVIHDTSGPNYGRRAFPDNIDTGRLYENLAYYACSDGWGRAHVFINRSGEMLLAHDYSIPWRETKFEQAAEFGGALQGLFLHTEMVQPRRTSPGHGVRNDARTPDPAFTTAQYDRLALLYTIASVRRGEWLVPAFHAAIDAEIPNGHDDPLNFDINSFANSLDQLLSKLE
ncbi:hypothetical protein [Bradyrhizobium diversitatis]|uniref:Uncharacterized protein n=1 Tax=Bradyrhizobium diversitatis TaxID=2755406 RepID=A0ABS0P5R6_9BRAD|nr:hypothetical protein [Bradyrhizobium diversitatis]MBH5388568.1 hypothetical protein [Bradyrhizobium diversitatis]